MKPFCPIAPGDVGLYVHVPFCHRKCDYCGFFSCPPQPGDVDAFLEGIREEIAQRLTPELAERLSTVFIGGGNPTILGSQGLANLLETLLEKIPANKIQEWTLETNPETFSPELTPILKNIPNLRISMGVQRLRDEELTRLGRSSTVHQAKIALDKAFQLTPNVGIDLILSLPGYPSPAFALQSFLERFPLTHLSSYFLTVEKNTPLEKRVRSGELDDPREMGPEDLLEIREVLKKAGLRHYEVSNFAIPGHECRHNLQYWNQNDYLGLGPAAVSTLNSRRLTNPATVRDWYKSLPESEPLDALTKAKEFVMLRLRLLEKGFSLQEFQHHCENFSGKFCTALEAQYLEGHLDPTKRRQGRICLTTPGMIVANQVLSALMEALE